MDEVDRYALVDGSYQHNLLRDAGRLDAYAKAVALAVRPGDVVADLGSGSGVLAHLAARAGARKVYAVEANRHTAAALRRLLERNGDLGAVEPVEADAERWVPPEPVDVVVAELMETGLLHEPMAAALRHVHAAWPRRPRAVVPAGATLLVEGVETEDTFHGYAAPLAGFRAAGSGRALTDAAAYAALDFARPPPEGVDAAVALRARERGTVRALRLGTVTDLAPGLRYETGPGYCTPVVLPLARPVAVEPGLALEARLSYTFAFDQRALRFALRTLP